MTFTPHNMCRKFKPGHFEFQFGLLHMAYFGGTCVEGLIFEGAHVASFSPDSLVEAARACRGDTVSLLSSLKL